MLFPVFYLVDSKCPCAVNIGTRSAWQFEFSWPAAQQTLLDAFPVCNEVRNQVQTNGRLAQNCCICQNCRPPSQSLTARHFLSCENPLVYHTSDPCRIVQLVRCVDAVICCIATLHFSQWRLCVSGNRSDSGCQGCRGVTNHDCHHSIHLLCGIAYALPLHVH